jgi:thioredoxin-dependent peroxiredoxin
VEASEFRDEYAQFKKAGAEVVAVSPDSPSALKKFHQQFNLPFTLLSDADKKLAQAYGVLKEKTMYGKKMIGIERSTFVISPDGKLQREFRGVKAAGHAAEVLAALK